MADKKITELNELSSPQANDLIPIVNVTTGETQKVKYSNIASNVDLSNYATIPYVDGLVANGEPFIENIVFKSNSDTTLEVDRLNWVSLSSNHSMTIASANSSNLGKILIINNRSNYELTIDLITTTDIIIKGTDSVVGLVCVTNGTAYNWEVFSRYNKGDFDDLALKANIASPTLTGTPSAPTATGGTNTTQIATTEFVTSAIGAIPTPTLATVTTAGNTTANQINFGGGTLTGALNEAPSVTLPSSATTDIGNANSNNIIISGTTTITSFGTIAEGVVRMIRFTGALTLTHNTTNLQLPNSTNITTQNGDTATFRSLGSGNWICISYKSVTTLTTNTVSKWDGSKLVNSGLFDDGTDLKLNRNDGTFWLAKTDGTKVARFLHGVGGGQNYATMYVTNGNTFACGVLPNGSFLASDVTFTQSGINHRIPINQSYTITDSANVTVYSHLLNTDIATLYGRAGSTPAFRVQASNGTYTDTYVSGTACAFVGRNATETVFGGVSELRLSSTQTWLRGDNHLFTNLSTAVQYAKLTSGGLAIGANAINASAQLHSQSTTKGSLAINVLTTAQRLAITNPAIGLQVFDSNLLVLCTFNGGSYIEANWKKYQQSSTNFVFVSVKSDFPTPSGGIITLLANTTYFINGTIDLTGDRLVCGANTTIIGGSSENCRIKSTGLVSALITSIYSLPLRNITLESSLALNLDGDGTTTALDWFGVNFTDCAVIGTVKDYTNFIISDCAFLNSGGMTLDGTFGSVGFSQSLFDCNTTNTVFILPATLTISRRFRIIYSSFVVLSGETGININASATIPTESYILDTVNFSGGGTYLTGVTHTSNDSLFINCVGITNTAVNGQLYMQSNATATTVSATNTFYKISGTTTASADNSKFSHSNNRLTCDAVISRKYLIQAHLSFTSGATNVCEFGFYDSVLATVRTPSKTKSTANASGKAENISFACVVTLGLNDYIEIHGANTSATNDITVDQLNFIITEIK